MEAVPDLRTASPAEAPRALALQQQLPEQEGRADGRPGTVLLGPDRKTWEAGVQMSPEVTVLSGKPALGGNMSGFSFSKEFTGTQWLGEMGGVGGDLVGQAMVRRRGCNSMRLEGVWL